jgi:hypothetical protein
MQQKKRWALAPEVCFSDFLPENRAFSAASWPRTPMIGLASFVIACMGDLAQTVSEWPLACLCGTIRTGYSYIVSRFPACRGHP